MSLVVSSKKKKKSRFIEVFPVRSYSEDEEYIRGPLGIWFFPILNAILAFIKKLRNIRTRQTGPRRRLAIYELVRDEYGRIIQIVEREIEA